MLPTAARDKEKTAKTVERLKKQIDIAIEQAQERKKRRTKSAKGKKNDDDDEEEEEEQEEEEANGKQ
jgi:hypothetical protein